MKLTQTVLSKREVEMIHGATMEVLNGVGIKVLHQGALKIFGESGAHVDPRQKLVKFPEYVIKDAVKRAPSSFTLFGRDPKYKLRFESGRVYYAAQSTSLFLLDSRTGKRRKATLRDVEDSFRLIDALGNIHHASAVFWPTDVSDKAGHAYQLFTALKNTIKTVDGFNHGRLPAMDTIKMASILAGGDEELKKKPRLLGFVNSTSPLQHSLEQTDGLLVYAEYEQPLLIAAAALSGATAPATLAGLLVQLNAEVLTIIALAQLVKPGLPVLYGSGSGVADARTGNMTYAVETGLISAATAQLARFYGVPSRGTGNITSSILPDQQAGLEKIISLWIAASAGTNLIYHAAGCLESTAMASLEQIVIDDEICGIVDRLLRGIEVNDDTLATNVISNVGYDGHYLGNRHTLRYAIQEHFIPTILNRDTWTAWEKKGSKDTVAMAHEKAERILREHHPEPLEPTVEKELRELVSQVEKR